MHFFKNQNIIQKAGIINLQGKFEQSGFGFSCLKQAANLEISGKFKYVSPEQVEIIISGSESAIQSFHQWCMTQKMTVSGDMQLLSEVNKFDEFEIVNHL
ncbi:MAG: acylphosphatase [Bacteroidales bacterium]